MKFLEGAVDVIGTAGSAAGWDHGPVARRSGLRASSCRSMIDHHYGCVVVIVEVF